MLLWLIIALMATRQITVMPEAFIFTKVWPRIWNSLPAETPCTKPPINAPKNSIKPALDNQPKEKYLPSA